MISFLTRGLISAVLLGTLSILPSWGGDAVRPGLEGLDWQSPLSVSDEEMALVEALKEPLIHGMDCERALQCWFDGRLADSKKDRSGAVRLWQEGLKYLSDLKPLPPPEFKPLPDAVFRPISRLRFPECEGTELLVVQWNVDGLRQYGIVMAPEKRPAGKRYPLLLYMHGAAYGVPTYALPWLARMVREGYVVAGPSMRGEDLFATRLPIKGLELKCGGEIENLDGEVNDALSAVSAARKLPYVRGGKFAIIGHSFGAGAGLLVTARIKDVACMVSYDAWLTNPFRYYWDRMHRGANNWLSWADFCNQSVADQLRGLMKRSIVEQAANISCPLLLFMGGAYDGSVFHLSHADFMAELRKYDKPFIYDLVPDGGHNFVLYYESKPAIYAFAKHMAFLREHFPPDPDAAPAAKEAGPVPQTKAPETDE